MCGAHYDNAGTETIQELHLIEIAFTVTYPKMRL